MTDVARKILVYIVYAIAGQLYKKLTKPTFLECCSRSIQTYIWPK